MTTVYPKASYRPVAGEANDPRIQPVGVVLHVAATLADSLYGWFDGPSGGIESHLYLRKDGTWEQYRDLEREADAQYRGNSWISGAHRNGFISVETQGLGSGEWTDAQLDAIKEFLVWASRRFGFPLRKVEEPQPSSPAKGGVGYHTQFASWSNVSGKTCPGPDRIKQFNNVLVPWMSGSEDDVAYTENQMVNFARLAVQAELGDENAGAFSDRVAQKVLAALDARPTPAAGISLDELAAKVADVLAERLKG